MELLLSLAPLLLTLVGIPIAWLIAQNGLAKEAEVGATARVAAVRGSLAWRPSSAAASASIVSTPSLFVRPITRLAGRGADPVNLASEGVRALTMRASRFLRLSQDGRPRRYLAVLALGAAILLAAVLL